MSDEKNDIDDVTFEDVDESSNPSALIKKLREKLKKTEIEKQEYLTGWQKAQAEFVNVRKRDEEAKSQAIKFAKADLIIELLPVLDSFDMAMSHKKAWEELPKDWRIGMESIFNQLNSILSSNLVKKINPIGEKFDPKKHEAIAILATGNKEEDHTVLEVLQFGYEFNGETIRPAKVKVGEYSENTPNK